MDINQYFPIGLEVNWKPVDQFEQIDRYLRNWLIDTGSLTERIQSLCRQFRVHVIGQGNAPIQTNESHLLTYDDSEYHVREVLLLADDIPWVFARSIIPKVLTLGEWRTLGISPLGKQLFNDTRFKRGDFEVAQVKTLSINRLIGNEQNNILYGRRSTFHFADQNILIAEVFLPQSPVYQNIIRHGK